MTGKFYIAFVAALAMATLASLTAPSLALGANVTARSYNANGSADFITGDLGQVAVTANTNLLKSRAGRASLDTRQYRESVADFVDQFARDHLGGSGAESFVVGKVRTDSSGTSHVRLNQSIHGLPVFGAQMVVHIRVKTGEVYLVNGDFVRADGVDRKPRVSARDTLTDALRSRNIGSFRVQDTGKLGYLPTHDGSVPKLVWRTRVEHINLKGPQDALVFVDAITGALVEYQTRTKTVAVRTYDAGFTNEVRGQVACRYGAACPDNVTQQAHDHAHATVEFYSDVFDRDSFDDEGFAVRSTVNFRIDPFESWNNATWFKRRLVYGDGDGVMFHSFARAFDVVAHEFTHGVIEAESDLIYRSESGALNEAWADVHSVGAKVWATGTLDEDSWHIGHDAFKNAPKSVAFRYMDNPTEDGVSADFYPERYVGVLDQNGVHLNSGIVNLAFYLLVTGGRHPRGVTTWEVPALGMDAAQQIFYRAQTAYMTPTSNFADARDATAFAALELYGREAFEAVDLAWCATGVPGCPFGDDILASSKTRSLENNVPVSNLSGKRYGMLWFSVEIPEGVEDFRVISRFGEGDADLLMRRGTMPSMDINDCFSTHQGNDEKCRITNPRPGTWYITLTGYEDFSGVVVRARYR